MIKFPDVLPIVRPLYPTVNKFENPRLCRHRSLETWRNNSVAPITRCHSEDATKTKSFNDHVDFECYGSLKITNNTKMYEPVANTCITASFPRYLSEDTATIHHETESAPTSLLHQNSDDSHHHHHNGDEKETKNNNNKLKTTSAPKKPPRRIKLQKINSERQQIEQEKFTNFENKTNNSSFDVDLTSKVAGDSHHVDIEDINRLSIESERNYKNRFLSVGVQVSPLPPYRLRLFPKKLRKVKSDPEKSNCNKDKIALLCTAAGRWLFSQCGLTIIIIIWALLGAAAFHHTEGPRELEQAEELATLQNNLAINMATELRQVVPHEPVWLSMVQKYFAKHESLLLNAVSAGYGEGGGGGHIWTYPGCVLFAVSLLTTLGFGAPVPRTTLGRGAAVLFSAVGIPLHFLLVLNIGVLIASKLQTWALRRTNYNKNKQHQTSCTSSPLSTRSITSVNCPTKQPPWLKWLPIATIAFYYLLGVILFGFVRQRNFADSLMFPLDFTATGGVAKTLGHVRILYALYLELAVTLAATMVSLLQVSASKGILNLGLKLGLLTNNT